MKDPNTGAKKIQEELDDKYQVKIRYGIVQKGFVVVGEQIHGTWETMCTCFAYNHHT